MRERQPGAWELRVRPFEDLDLHVLDPELPTEPDEFGPLVGGEGLLKAMVDVGLVDPDAEARVGDAEIGSDLAIGFSFSRASSTAR